MRFDLQKPEVHLIEVKEKRFEEILVTEDTDLFNFITKTKEYHFKRGISYFEFVCVEEDINDDREVILKDEVSSLTEMKQLYSISTLTLI